MTKYLNMAPACYQADDSKSGVHLPLMVAGAAATAVYTSLAPDNGKSHRNAVGGHCNLLDRRIHENSPGLLSGQRRRFLSRSRH
jgi:hypothetical protein